MESARSPLGVRPECVGRLLESAGTCGPGGRAVPSVGVSTRMLIILALLCGLALVVAFAIQAGQIL